MKMADEEYGSRAIWQELLTDHGNWKNNAGILVDLDPSELDPPVQIR